MLSSRKVADSAQNISLTVKSGADFFLRFFGYYFAKYAGYRKELCSGNTHVIINFKRQVQWDDQRYLSKGKIAVLCAGIKKEKIQAGL